MYNSATHNKLMKVMVYELEKYLRADANLFIVEDDEREILIQTKKELSASIKKTYNEVVELGFKSKEYIDEYMNDIRKAKIEMIAREKAKKDADLILEASFKGNKYVTCNRCRGNGVIKCYKHVDFGICYKCNGKTKVLSAAYKRHMCIREIDLVF